jgi:hypothetical protein
MKRSLILLTSMFVAVPAAHACPPAGWTRDGLGALKGGGFKIDSSGERDAAAKALLACLDDPDPAIRDGVVFEGVSRWLRAKGVSPAAMRDMTAVTLGALTGPDDVGGFRRPFAALILSELVRADRVEPFLESGTRKDISAAATAYMRVVSDYRGFDPKEGWRHGVAHGADLVMQLALNPAVGANDVKDLMAAVATKIAPVAHAYTRGEPDRLARAVHQAFRRGVLTDADWDAWFAVVSAPAPFAAWQDSFASAEGLNKRHNAGAFFKSLHFAAHAADDSALALRAKAAAQKM